jgi:hypothetical protein
LLLLRFTMLKIGILLGSLFLSIAAGTTAFLIRRSRRQSIIGIRGRNKHFGFLARQLHLMQGGDDYFTQLEGDWKGHPVLIYPHNFHGPGSITLVYTDTGIPVRERTWIEPSLSLGRAIVDWKLNIPFQHEFAGDHILNQGPILEAIERYKPNFPFIAVTLPTRFIFSHFVMQSFEAWKNFVVVLALDTGRTPSVEEMEQVLDASVDIAENVRASIQQSGVSPAATQS